MRRAAGDEFAVFFTSSKYAGEFRLQRKKELLSAIILSVLVCPSDVIRINPAEHGPYRARHVEPGAVPRKKHRPMDGLC